MKAYKIKKRQILFVLITLLWMGIIFWFSSRTGDESSAQSGGIVHRLLQFLLPDFTDWSMPVQEKVIDIVTLLVRKASHAMEYLILGLLLLGCQSWRFSIRRTLLTAWILTVCYAASDEIHQYFVPDRACMFTDVLIDSTGAALGLFIVYQLLRWQKKKQN